MLQMRHRGTDDPFYAPHRDISYVTHHLAVRAVGQLDQINWGQLRGFFEANGVTEEQLGEGAKVLAAFLNHCTDEVADTMPHQVLERVGFTTLPFPVQVALVYALGQQFMGAFFVCVREVTHKDEAPPLDMQAIVDAADASATYLNMPRWRRWLAHRTHRVREWLLTRLGANNKSRIKLPKGPKSSDVAIPDGAVPPPNATLVSELPDNLPRPGVRPE